MIDIYTKAVLTVIACALCTLVLQNVIGPARALSGHCGSTMQQPCWIISNTALDVIIRR